MSTSSRSHRGRAAHASGTVAADPDVVFATVTDIAALPSWNAVMTRVVEQPPALEPGAQWVVEFHALGQTWHSRSRVEEIDTTARRFVYQARTDDGNPSFAQWRWQVKPDPKGSRVTVAYELHPATCWRRVLLAHVRARQLSRRELPASIQALTLAARARTTHPAT